MNQAIQNTTSHKVSKTLVHPSELYSETESSVQKKSKSQVNASQELQKIPTDVVQSFASDVIGGILDGFTRQLLGQPAMSGEVLSQPKVLPNQEALIWKRKFQLAERRRLEVESLFVRKEQESKHRLMTIRQELQMQVATLSHDMAAWAHEVEVATFQTPADPGIYHEHFFEKLLTFVKNMRKRIQSSRHWLHMHNVKVAKKQGLWGLAQKGNTLNQEIMYSSERAISMSG